MAAMALSRESYEYYLQAYRDALANNEDSILEVLEQGDWDQSLNSLLPSALTEEEWQKIKQIDDRKVRAKEILALVRKKDDWSSYIGLSRALCGSPQFLKQTEVFPFVSELEQNGRHPPVQSPQLVKTCKVFKVINSYELDKEVRDEYLPKISPYLKNWKLVASHLHLTTATIEAIESEARRDENLHMLEEWKKCRGPDGTYHALLEALIKCNSSDCILQVCGKWNYYCQHLATLPDFQFFAQECMQD